MNTPERVPTTAAQREIWTAAQLGTAASLSFNEAVAISLDGALDVEALRGAITQVVQRHDALRAVCSADGAALLVRGAADAPFEVIDASSLDAVATADAIARHQRMLVDTPFDLTDGPLVRFALLRTAPDRHLLTIVAHHIVCDGWSFGVLAGELGMAYSAACGGQPLNWPPAERWSRYERALVAEGESEEAMAAESFWIERFREPVAPLELPLDRPRPATRRFEAGREDLVLDMTTVDGLKRTAAAQGSTLFATLLTGFASLIARLSQQDDVVIGIPVAGQPRLGVPQLIGHCVNLLPLRLAPDGSQSFATFAGAVRGVLFDAMDHQQLTYGALLTQLPIRRDPSRLPLVSVVFNLDRGIGTEQLGFVGLRGALHAVPRTHENFELFLNAVELDGTITLELQYSRALFDAATVRRWLRCYHLLLRGIVHAPTLALDLVPWVPGEDLDAIDAWQGDVRPLDEARLAHHRVAEWAARTPDAIAVSDGQSTRSYAALCCAANRLAHALREAGAQRGRAVGVLVPRDVRLSEAWLAVLQSGAAYVPLDRDLPIARLQALIEDAGLSVVVTTAELRSLLPSSYSGAVIALDSELDRIAACPATPLAPSALDATADDVAFVIYTSGSTGTPKGCRNTHRGLLAFAVANAPETAPAPGGVVLGVAAVSFDASVGEQLLALVHGARLVIVARDVAADGSRLSALMAYEGVTFMFATPATYRLLMTAGWQGSRALTITCGGEPMTTELAEALLARSGAAWNVYGPTETAIWCARAKLTSPPGRITIGGPMANSRFAVCDAHGAPVPIGVPGELWIAGPNVALGYHRRDDLTAERFPIDDESSLPGARRYRTGDVVRWVASGEIEYVGRNDDQVKLRGYRIELGEIATRLMERPDVDRALVRVREDVPGDRRLVAYISSAKGAVVIDDGALRAHLAAQVPAYMIPQAFVVLPAFPLLPSGKINVHALPAPSGTAPASARPYRAPTTDREREIAASWARALRVARVSVDDDFFELGGHSLLASQVLADLRARHALDVPYRLFFEAPTVAELAAAVDAMQERGERGPVVAPIPHRLTDGVAPVTVAQRRLWMLEALDPANRMVMAHTAAWRLHGALDADALEAAIRDVIARHGSMRTRFAEIDGTLQQIIEPAVSFALQRVDLAAVPADLIEQESTQHFATFHDRPFDLSSPPLFRALLERRAPDEHLLYTVQHVLIWDGWSFDVFLADLSTAYAARCSGHAPQWTPLPVTYADYAAWQAEHLRSETMASQSGWWDTHLAGTLPVLELPTDRPRPPQSSYAGDRVTMRLDVDDVESLRRAAQRDGATLFQYLFTAFHVLLHRYSGQRELMVGMPLRNRSRAEIEGVIGSFVNTVVVRSEVAPSMTFAELLRQIRQTSILALEHQEVPFELLDRRPPAVRALFSMQDARERPPSLGDCRIEQFTMAEHTAANDLMLWTMEYPSSLLVVLSYRTDLFDGETAETMVEQFLSIVRDAVRASETYVDDFAMLPGVAAPDPASVTSGEVRWTTSSPLATALQRTGLRPGDTVVVRCRADADRVALAEASLATQITVAYLAADDHDAYTSDVIANVGARMLVSDTTMVDCPIPQATVVELLAGAIRLSGEPTQPQSVAAMAIVSPDAPAPYIQHCDVPGVTRHARALAEALGWAPGDVLIDGSVDGTAQYPMTALAARAVGATRIGVGRDQLSDGAQLRTIVTSNGRAHLVLPAPAIALLRQAGWNGDDAKSVLVVGPLRQDDVRWLCEHCAVVRRAEYSAVMPGPVALTELPSGRCRALAGLTPEVVRGDGRPQVSGVPGVAQFAAVTSVLTQWPARRRRSGVVELGARPENDLVIGDRVFERDAIGRVLAAAAGVSDATVMAMLDAAGTTRVIGYVPDLTDATDSELRTRLRAVSPLRVIPQLFERVPELPRRLDGTIDLARLPGPMGLVVNAAPRVPPQTDEERLLAEEWASMLNVSGIVRTDNFFALGGYSLLAFQLLDRIEERTGCRLNPRTLLFGSLEQVAAELAATAPTVPVTMAASPHAPSSRGVLSRWRSWLGGSGDSPSRRR
jgi:amino acid adenylation domain-containing protein